MALVMLGGGVTDLRGSIAGTTFSRGAGGNIARSRKKPCTRHLALQCAARRESAAFTEAWSSVLSDARRSVAWTDYASGTTWTNRLGQAITISGLSAFVRLNVQRLQNNVAIQAAAPTELGHATEPGLTVTASAATQQFTIPNVPTGWDHDLTGNVMNVYNSQPAPAGRAAVPPVRFYFSIAGNVGAPPAFPFSYAYGRTFVQGQHLWLAATHADLDGRLSSFFYTSCLAGA